jgi:hypothetical protein
MVCVIACVRMRRCVYVYNSVYDRECVCVCVSVRVYVSICMCVCVVSMYVCERERICTHWLVQISSIDRLLLGTHTS